MTSACAVVAACLNLGVLWSSYRELTCACVCHGRSCLLRTAAESVTHPL